MATTEINRPGVSPYPQITPDLPANSAPPQAKGKKIILLSDGTGNSERSPFKTNVWRTYQALKLAEGKQVAYYDNGVGTSTWRPLALLGGAFGWGLKRNVLTLYKFLCRKYKPGDEIYGFGFSRGAFTIRVLVGLVESQGLIRYKHGSSSPIPEAALTRYAAAAYRDYRRERFRAPLARVGRSIRDFFLRQRDEISEILGIAPYNSALNVQVQQIRFLGLWDTVDAYGLPIRELKSAVDRYIWPLTFQNLELSEKVQTARHALALDDERATFHPLVWDERQELANNRPSDRIRQVWFPGVHANVGGGYPDDSLAYVPLLWILKEAHDAGLELEWEVTDLYEALANPFGKIYDSRAARAAFYRYSPRRVEVLVDDSRARARRADDALPKTAYSRTLIHPTVFQRIDDGQYAPISIHGPFVDAETGGPGRRYNDEAMEVVLDTVWWRRTAYWAMMLIAMLIIAFPWLPSVFYSAPDERGSEWLSGFFIVSLAKKLTPAFASPWIDGFAAAPVISAGLIVAGIVTFLWGSLLRDRVTDRARAAWVIKPDEKIDRGWLLDASESFKVIYRLAAFAQPMLAQLPDIISPDINRWLDRRNTSFGLTLRLARVLRTNAIARSAGVFISKRAIPFLFLLAIGLGTFYVANGVMFAFLNATDSVCTQTDAAVSELTEGMAQPLKLDISSPCLATGIRVTAGAKYRIDFLNPTNWRDDAVNLAAFPDPIVKGEKRPRVATEGYNSGEQTLPLLTRVKLVVAAPIRRVFGADWLTPIARIGAHSHEEYVLGANSTLIEPQHSGELFLYVNDAVLGLPGLWDVFYRDNVGSVTVKIRRVEPPASY